MLGAPLATIDRGVMPGITGRRHCLIQVLARRLRPLRSPGVALVGPDRHRARSELEVTGAVTRRGADRARASSPGRAGAGAAARREENLIPPNVRARAVQVAGGGYCYGGPHPAPGGGWEAITTPHTHNYAPFDLRLFSQHEGCYYFIGDPRDFGYTGQVYSYYGAHPVADVYGGGWCFMVGGHYHWWRPWSPYFTVVGPWYYWYGPYDPFFWSYWPYYSFYYRSYYPSYYAGGRYYRNGYRAAPAITRVPRPAGAARRRRHDRGPGGGGAARRRRRRRRRCARAARRRGGWRGAPGARRARVRRARRRLARRRPRHPAAAGTARGARPGGAWRGGGARRAGGGGWHGGAPSGGGWHGGAPSGGGWHGGAPSGGGFRAAAAVASAAAALPRRPASTAAAHYAGRQRGTLRATAA